MKLFFSLLLLMSASAANAEKVANCLIKFKTRGAPQLVSIEGKSDIACTGDLVIAGADYSKSKLTLDLSKLDTGIPLRNKHLKDNYLHVAKFPTATISDLAVKDAASKGTFTAMLEIHGSKKPVQGSIEVKDGQYKGSFEIDLPEFGIERPSFMGVKVVDKVAINFSFKAEK